MIKTIKENGFKVLDNEIARKYFQINELVGEIEAKKETIFYSNSENSIDWIIENKPNSQISKMIQVSKDKIEFRKMLSKIYPDYYFEEITFDEIQNFKPKKYPFILKPSVGFLSFGVYPIYDAIGFENVKLQIQDDIKKIENIFPTSVVNCSKFLIEEMISGDEYAIDAYFDENGEAVILNIFQHPFLGDNDVSDRVYYTSKNIIQKYLNCFKELLDKIGSAGNYKNFPFHLELRANENMIVPIELNPMRFCGWCITDIAHFAWGINPYIYFEKKLKPDWNEILKDKNDDFYYFTIGDIPKFVDKSKITGIDWDKYLKTISNPLDVRKIDYKTKPVFAICFGQCDNLDEINNHLKANMPDYIRLN